MSALYAAASQGPQQRSQERSLFFQVDPWDPAACELVYVFVVLAPAHFIGSVSDDDEIVSFLSESLQYPRSLGFYQSYCGDDRRRLDRPMVHGVFVVEADLAADAWDSESFEIVGNGSNSFPECPVDLRISRVSEL